MFLQHTKKNITKSLNLINAQTQNHCSEIILKRTLDINRSHYEKNISLFKRIMLDISNPMPRKRI